MLDTGRERNPDYVQSLERGLAVIKAFGADARELRLSDVTDGAESIRWYALASALRANGELAEADRAVRHAHDELAAVVRAAYRQRAGHTIH